MRKGAPAIVSILVFAVLVFLGLKLLGIVLGFAFKVLLLAIAVAVAGVVYLAVRKQIGGTRAP